MLVAQILSLLYNIVDRIYIARIPHIGTAALGAVGLCFPVIVIITAFSNLFGSGGAPLFSIERGKNEPQEAKKIMNISFSMVCVCAIVLMVIGFLFARPILVLFGASKDSLIYAYPYLMLYLIGTLPSMIATGMNPFINAQGYSTIGMLSVTIGAVTNLLLDPLFIFVFGLGVRGAAIATVISQTLSAAFVFFFLTKKAELKVRLLKKEELASCTAYAKNIVSLGTAGFIMQLTNSLVTIVCNNVLSVTGGDIYISVMTIVSSVRQLVETPIYAINEGTSPILSYNYGARRPCRVRKAGAMMALMILGYTAVMWSIIIIAPKKGHEFRPLCEKLGGLYLRMSPSSKDCPNLMAIRRRSLDSYAKLKNIAARDDSVLADKIAQLIIWFSLKKKDLNEEDKSRLDSSLVEVYGRYGITFDNRTIVDEDGSFRTMPVIADWYEVLSKNPDTRHLAVVLSRYVTGSAAAMASRNDIDLDNKYIVLDLSGMPDDMIADGTFWATSVAYDLIMNCESGLSALLADELWSLVGATANPQAAGFILEMVKTIRGLGGIAVTSTQGMQDLFGLEGGSYGKGILDASRIKLVMQMEEQEARLIQDKLNLSEDEVRQITRFRRGEGLLCIGYNHVPVAFYTTPKEYEAITTSPTDLRRERQGDSDE